MIDGPSVYFHSAFYYIAPGDVLYSRIDLNKNVKGGKYCGETEGLSGYNYGTACETVS
ncbi:MAG TPA: hypothetical protein VMV92_26555 [Streptosporangiaceae bacterium]|nr:hypothetical protein [Streptosporangiaceae bacterium]